MRTGKQVDDASDAARVSPGSQMSPRIRVWALGRQSPVSRLWSARTTLLGVVLAILALVWLYESGSVDVDANTLQVMGFDPDRAALITALLNGAIAAAIVSLVGGRFWVAVLTGAAAVLVGFFPVFRQETGAALRSRGAAGTFDPIGWALTVVTLVVAAVIVGWAAAVLGADVRRRLGSVGAAVKRFVQGRQRSVSDVRRVAVAVVVVVLLVVALPTFGDLMNFDPDVHMIRGAPAGVGLFNGADLGTGAGDGTGGTGGAGAAGAAATNPSASSGGQSANSASGGPGAKPGPLVVPSNLVAGPIPGSFATAGALSAARPWSAHPPTGGGRTFSVNLPAPWTGGLTDYSTIDIYLPPGYDAGTARYPVIYEPHQPLWAWEQGMHVASALNSLIDSGTIPPEIFVFVGQYGGPYADSECADSWDGKEWFDRYLGQDVPAWVDSHLRTIATPAARALLGFSSGGYCAAAAITHHPEVFDSAAIFSGYFVAGIKTSTTPVAWRPFNGDPVLESKVSPIEVVPRLPAAERSTMFIAFSADPANKFYAAQITDFAQVLDANGVSLAVLPTPLGHSWSAVREQLPAVLTILAQRQAKLGVFAPG